MKAGILGDLRRFGLDILVGLAIFSVIAMLVLDGEAPRQFPQVTSVLSLNANAAEYLALPAEPPVAPVGLAAEAKPFRFTDGWTALSAIAVMFAMLYAFNLALFRHLCRNHLLSRRLHLSTR